MTDKQPILGIMLDEDDATEESSTELLERDAVMPWVIEDPSFWSVPFRRTIAKGADAVANKVPTPDAAHGILDAANRLDGETQLILGNCGYMWASRNHVRGTTATPTMTSGLDLLELALQMTNRPVGVITWDEVPLEPLLRDHPGWDRIRLLGLCDLPDWKKSVRFNDYMKPGGWTLDRMADQFAERLADSLAEGGVFEDVGILVVECTCVANFRSAVRSVTSLAVLDIVHFAEGAFKLSGVVRLSTQ
jgi:hypothetical protein